MASVSSLWNCPACDFVNAASAHACLICGTAAEKNDEPVENKEVDYFVSECPYKLQKCSHVNNIITLLQKFEVAISIDQLYSSDIRSKTISSMKDFLHVQQYHNKTDKDHDYFQKHIGYVCDKNADNICSKESRHRNRYRNFSQYDMFKKNVSYKQDAKDEIMDINLIQLLDTIHCSLLHKTVSNSTKFITNVNTNDEKEEMKSNNEFEDLPKYQFGEAFNVTPKYSNLKAEFLQNGLLALSMKQYECLKEKGNNFMQCYKKEFLFAKRESRYKSELHTGDPMNIEHIIVVMSYCNIDDLQRSFKDGFRLVADDTNEDDIKQRQYEIATWTRFLLEAITLFGDVFKFGEKVYHGLSCKLQFDKMGTTFSMPTSTSMSLIVAQNFATNYGIILELTRGAAKDSSNLYLDVYSKYLFTDYPNEQERLIFGTGLGFSNIIYEDVYSEINHNKETMSLYLYQQIIYGKYFTYRKDIFKEEYEKNIINYMKIIMKQNKSNNELKVDKYILYLFQSVSVNVKKICFIETEFKQLCSELQTLLSKQFANYLCDNYSKKLPIYAMVMRMDVKMESILSSSNNQFGGHIKSASQSYKIDDSDICDSVTVYFTIFKDYVKLENKTYFDAWITIEELDDEIENAEITALLWIEEIQFSGYMAGQVSSKGRFTGGHMFEMSKIENFHKDKTLQIEVAIQDVKLIKKADKYWSINEGAATVGGDEQNSNIPPKADKYWCIEFKKWLTETVQLPQYYDLFIENGFDDFVSIQQMSIEELEEIGIDKIGHRKKIMRFIGDFKYEQNINIPQKFICPLTQQIMNDPVVAFDGNTYEKNAIEQYLSEYKKSPITNEIADTMNVVRNFKLRKEIESFTKINNNVDNDKYWLNQTEGCDSGNTFL